MVTIKDIANEAGVSHGTVSNVLNRTGKVSIEKIRAVEDAMKRLGYVPNTEARKLRKGESDNVAIIIPSLGSDGYRDLYYMLRSVLEAAGCSTSLYISHDIEGVEEAIIERSREAGLRAVAAVTCLGAKAALWYSSFSCPVIFIDRRVPDPSHRFGFVGFDFDAAGRDIADMIRHEGYRNVAFFSSPSRFPDDSTLFSSLSSSLDSECTLIRYTSDRSLAISKSFSIITEQPDLDAVIVTGLSRAESFFTALKVSGKEMKPRIISMSSARKFPHPVYTTYELDYSTLGRTVAEAVRDRRPPSEIDCVLPCKGFPFLFNSIGGKKHGRLSLLTIPSPSTNALSQLLPMFREASGIDVDIIAIPHDSLLDNLRRQSDESHYDLIRFDVVQLPTMEDGLLQPLCDSCGYLSGSRMLEFGDKSSSRFAFPFEPAAMIMLYRTDIFSDAVLSRAFFERYRRPLSVPRTLNEYLDISRFLTRAFNPDSPTEYGTTSACAHLLTASNNFLIFALSMGVFELSSGSVKADRNRLIDAISYFLQIVECSNPRYSTWWNDCVQDFAQGLSATVITYSNHVNYLMNSKHSSVVGRIGAAMIPGGSTLLGGGMLGISAFSKKADECHQFMQWYYSEDISSAITALGGSAPISAPYDDSDNQISFPWLAVAKKSMKTGVRGLKDCPSFKTEEFETMIGSAIQLAVTGELSPEQTADMIIGKLLTMPWFSATF